MSDDTEEEQSSIKGRRGFRKGISGNKEGRPKKADPTVKGPYHKRSKLRATERKLLSLNPRSLENIEKSVNGEDVDKEVLSTSRWVITTTASVSKQAMQEEIEINGLRDDKTKREMEEEQAEDEESNARFTLEILPALSDLTH